MLFNSLAFFVFLPIVFILYWFVFNKNLNRQNLVVLIASYWFYGCWDFRFLFLLAFSTLLDYYTGLKMGNETNPQIRKYWLRLSITINLGFLAIFKYFNFFSQSFVGLMSHFGVHANPWTLQIILPVGISFYTFHGLSYVLDVYHNRIQPEKKWLPYAVFVGFFPLLVAGPIERANHLLPQVQTKRIFSYTKAVEGCKLIIWGMFKKVVIADSLASIVNAIFYTYKSHNAATLILGAVGFSFQIYGDFSGYSDIALGTAKLFGFELLSNFKFPYFSRDLAEFWRRWHISLSSWFKDYLYIPLGGSKQGKLIAVRNVFIVFLLSGFWHGASWNFIVWGGIHACGFLPLLLLDKNRKYVTRIVSIDRKLPRLKELAQIIMTFGFVTFAWIFFMMHSLKAAINYIKQIVVSSIQYPAQFIQIPKEISILYYIIPFLYLDWHFRRNERNLRINKVVFIIMSLIVLNYLVYQILDDKKSEFIYFRF